MVKLSFYNSSFISMSTSFSFFFWTWSSSCWDAVAAVGCWFLVSDFLQKTGWLSHHFRRCWKGNPITYRIITRYYCNRCTCIYVYMYTCIYIIRKERWIYIKFINCQTPCFVVSHSSVVIHKHVYVYGNTYICIGMFL